MQTPNPGEKATPVMAYTSNMLVRGEVITRESVRVSIWLRTEGAPRYIRITKAQILMMNGAVPRPMTYPEIIIPADQVVAFHPLPPTVEQLDYEENEKNRVNSPIELLAGSFLIKCKVRLSTQTDLLNTLDVSHAPWYSIYDLSVSHPALPQMAVSSFMGLVRPNAVTFCFLP